MHPTHLHKLNIRFAVQLTQRFFNMTPTTVACLQLHWFKPVDIFPVEEHESNNGILVWNFEGMTTQENTLNNETSWVDGK